MSAPVVTLPYGWHLVPRHLPDEVLVDTGDIGGYDGQRGDAEHREWWESAIDSIAARVPLPVLTYTPAPPAAAAVPRTPDGYVYRYPSPWGGTVLKFTNGEDVNGNRPLEAVPYWLGTPPAQQPAAAVPKVTLEMIGAGMKEWDTQHSAGVRSWPTMLEAVFLAMLAAARKGEL